MPDVLDRVAEQAEEVVQAAIPPTAIFLLLDESSSMAPNRDATIDGVNEFLADQSKQPGRCYFSLTKFASRVDVLGTPVEISSFLQLTHETYKPNGNTALYDAIAATIERAEEWLTTDYPATLPTPQMLFVIQTDGHENNSTDNTAEMIRKLISKKTEDKWDFVFLGADQDAILAAGRLGIAPQMSSNYAGTQAGTKGMLRGMTNSVSSYRSKGRDAMVNDSFIDPKDLTD